MNWTEIILFGIGAYVLGSIPTAVWIGKWFYNTDVREQGSGNAGFSNALRVFGPKVGIPVLIIDVAKGFAAVKLASLTFLEEGSIALQLVPVIYGILAFIGHLVPILARFKGGKGVATGLGMILALFPMGAALGIGVFLIVIFSFRMMSLGSMLGSISLPITVFLTYKTEKPVLLIFSLFISLMILYTHRSNIKRILQGTENRIWFRKKPAQ
ncbi:MAG: glycerol-3-phosphate 1-O-acyltransferase PlsY [Bacteroidota bacterium]|nr:glycerol-3-phosphate 1-O-acyltransferase PlsY [Bacteroidota bacterium]